MSPTDWPVGRPVGECSRWVDVRCRRAQATAGDAITGEVALGFVRKQAEQELGSKPGSTVPPCSLLQLLPPGSGLELLSWISLMMNSKL